jgi:gluconate 2-dehydrogenase alpha chain
MSATVADVVLVGLGASCAIAADVLTARGLEIVAFEAGPRLDAAMMTSDEIRNDVREWMSQPKAAHEIPTWRASAGEEAGPAPWPMRMVNAVGGTTIHYPGLSARLTPWVFEARSRTRERYGAAAIPPAATLVDWPLSYAELEPWYDRVEQAIGVAGAGGAGNPFEGERSRPYPLPPLRRSGWTELMDGAARQLGWHPFPAPAAINSVPNHGNGACTYCGFCTSNGCHRDAKGTADVTSIPRAEATGRLRVEPNARVERIESGADGRVTGVHWVRDGVRRFQAARVVLVGTFTYENTRLLLLSRSAAYPRGLANNHDQVGRHYTAHVTPFAYGRFPGRRLGLHSGPWAQATCVDDWNGDNFDHDGLGFLGGGLCTAAHELKPIAAALAPLPPGVPRWGAGWRDWLREHAPSVGGVGAQFESLTYEHNRLDLDPRVRDPSGTPVVRVTYRPGENERRGNAFMRARLRDWLMAAGAEETWGSDQVALDGRHSYGGTRMGDDPATSVVDRWGFAHEAPNLGLLGSSTFPASGGHNPTLTVQALAWRNAQRLADAWDTVGRN